MVTTSCCWIVVGGRVHGCSYAIRCDMSDKHTDRGSSWITTIAPSKVSRIGYIFMIKSKCALFCQLEMYRI